MKTRAMHPAKDNLDVAYATEELRFLRWLYVCLTILGWLGIVAIQNSFPGRPVAPTVAFIWTLWPIWTLLSVCLRTEHPAQRNALRALPVRFDAFLLRLCSFAVWVSMAACAPSGIILMAMGRLSVQQYVALLLANCAALAVPIVYHILSIWRYWAAFRTLIRRTAFLSNLVYAAQILLGVLALTRPGSALLGLILVYSGGLSIARAYGRSFVDVNIFWFIPVKWRYSRFRFLQFAELYLNTLSLALFVGVVLPLYFALILADLELGAMLFASTAILVIAAWPIVRVFLRDDQIALWTLPLRPLQIAMHTSIVPGTILVAVLAAAMTPVFYFMAHIPPAMTLAALCFFCAVMYGSRRVTVQFGLLGLLYLCGGLLVLSVAWCMSAINLYVVSVEGQVSGSHSATSTAALWLLVFAVAYACTELRLLYRIYNQRRIEPGMLSREVFSELSKS